MNTTASSHRLLLSALIGLAAMGGIGCEKKSSDDEKKSEKGASKKESKKESDLPEPDFEMPATKLAGAYADDPAGTDKKYGSKTVKLRGEISEINIYEDTGKAFVTLNGGGYGESSKLGVMRKEDGQSASGIVKVSCMTKPGTYVKFMKGVVAKAPPGGKMPVGTIQGEYEKGYPLSGPGPAVQLNACQLIEPKEE